MKRSVALLVFALVGAMLSMAAPANATVSTIVVDDDGFGVLGNCNEGATAALTTIGSAVAAATAGGAIFVCPGSYPEVVNVTKSLTLSGAKAGVDARTRATTPATESVVGTAGGAFVLNASDVTVDGFTITGNTNSFWGTGLFAANTTSGATLVNNYVHDNIIGMYVNSNGVNQTLVEHNLFANNNNPGPAGGTALYSDQGLQNAVVTENTFTGNEGGAFTVSPYTGATEDITYSDNVGTGNGNFGVFVGPASNIDILDNTATGSPTGGSQVYLSGLTDVLVDGNTVSNAATTGIRLDAGPNSQVTITNNTLTGNLRAIRVESGALAGSPTIQDNSISGNGDGIVNLDSTIVDGAHNWWGDASGPSNWSIGSGDTVTAGVDFFPWATNAPRTTFAACSPGTMIGGTLTGTKNADILCGTAGIDTIAGKGGKDLVLAGGGADMVKGGPGNDALIGDGGDDRLAGNAGFDSLQGRDGTDKCIIGVDGGQKASCEA